MKEGSYGERAYLSFGGGLKFLSEAYFMRILGPMGMTRQGFRAFCRALKVPMLEVHGTRLVEVNTMRLALRAISRVGQPNFYAPGAKTLGQRKKAREPGVTELDAAYYEREWRKVVAELLAARKMNGAKIDKEIRDLAEEAAKRITTFALQLQPAREQEQHDRRALMQAEKEGIFDVPFVGLSSAVQDPD